MYFYVLILFIGIFFLLFGYFDFILYFDVVLLFIEIIVLNVFEEIIVMFDMVVGGQILFLFEDDDLDIDEVYVGVWDWKKGVCFGVSDLFVWLRWG